jgi:hypothetical protein
MPAASMGIPVGKGNGFYMLLPLTLAHNSPRIIDRPRLCGFFAGTNVNGPT